jgi:2-polyprenyl-3-methyl-5-hydroxy-6-metoxy-1,4-benzoquinol methylase
VSILLRHLESQIGSFDHRVIEYPWVLAHLPKEPGAIVLDIGCSESLLSHELIARGYRVVGLDLRDCPWKNQRILFFRRNIMHTCLPSGIFDVIIAVSTVEHVGLNQYGQLLLDNDGDILTMQELYRLLKKSGTLLLTTPYIGKAPLRIDAQGGRLYNCDRLNKLAEKFTILGEEYFLPLLGGGASMRRCRFLSLQKKQIDSSEFIKHGIACLILTKA